MTTAKAPESYFRGQLRGNVIQQVVLFAIFAGLATSRAASHVLSAAAVCGIATVAAAGSAQIGWVTNLYAGAHDRRRGLIAIDADNDNATDPFAASTLWRTSLVWALGAAAWAAAGAGIVAVALNGRVVRFSGMFVALVGLVGVAVVAIGIAARRRGVASASAVPSQVVPLRRRAWRELALPFAVAQGLVNAGVGWMLFHAYPTGDATRVDVLTDSTALADALIIVVLLTMIFSSIAVTWGWLDRVSGRITLDDAETQTVPRRAPIGPQGLVYAAILGLVCFRIAGFVLPATPSLAAVMITRGVLSAVVVGLAVGFGYTRGACNEVTE